MDRKQGFFDVDLLCDEVAEEEVSHGGKPESEEEELIQFPFPGDECFGWMIEREALYLPRSDYLTRLRTGEVDMGLRREALDWMLKACGYHRFGEMCFCSAVNYLDRFLSLYDLPVGKTWTARLVAVACLLLAAKMEEVNVPNAIDLQYGVIQQQQQQQPGGEVAAAAAGAAASRFLFESRTIQRMEILILNSLKWNVKPYTPLNFVEYFLRKLTSGGGGGGGTSPPPPEPWMIGRSIQIVSTAIKGIDFLEFRPSEIAASVAVYIISGEMQQPWNHEFISSSSSSSSSSLPGLEKDRVIKCLELIQDLISSPCSTTGGVVTSTSSSSSSSTANSPNGVLEAAFWSDAVGSSCPSSSQSTPDGGGKKRRRLMDP